MLSVTNRLPCSPTGPWTMLICVAVALSLCSGCGKPAPTQTAVVDDTGADVSSADEPDTSSSEPATVSEATPSEPSEPEAPTFGPAPEGKVLRHAVFFSFKETSTDEDVQRIVDAFRALPSKIEEIIDFQWGVNNSPEKHDDGFTHCFFLTFADEAGRAAYIPHDAHKEFGNVLRGHNDKVFVLDYWGDATLEPMEKELKHLVFFRFKEDAAEEDIKKVAEAFAELPSKIDTIKRFEWGTNNSPERHAAGFTHCFAVSFDSEEGRATYLDHPDHQAFVKLLPSVIEAPRVLDFWAEK